MPLDRERVKELREQVEQARKEAEQAERAFSANGSLRCLFRQGD